MSGILSAAESNYSAYGCKIQHHLRAEHHLPLQAQSGLLAPVHTQQVSGRACQDSIPTFAHACARGAQPANRLAAGLTSNQPTVLLA